jgi:hypothetical protein
MLETEQKSAKIAAKHPEMAMEQVGAKFLKNTKFYAYFRSCKKFASIIWN